MSNKMIFRPPESFQENTTKTLVLVDWSNLMYRAWFSSREEPWIATCKFFDMLRLCGRRSKQPGVPLEMIFCGESRVTLRRKELYSEYKGNRKYSQNEEFAKWRKGLRELIESLGYKLISIDKAEADDVIASIVKSHCHRCHCLTPCEDCKCAEAYTTDVVIFSGDRDLQQLLSWDRTLVYRAPGVFMDKRIFEELYDIPVEKYTIYKALIGDTSDNIQGVAGFGPKKAVKAINAGTVPEDIYELGGSEGSRQFRLAVQLVSLDTGLEINLKDIYKKEPKLSGFLERKLHRNISLEIKRFREVFRE